MADKEEEPTNSADNNDNGKAAGTPENANEEVPQSLEPASSRTNTPSTEAPPPPEVKDNKKVEILLKATGDAPIMAKKKWVVDQEKSIGGISEFIKKYIKLGPEERLFLYINQTFAPAPDQTIKNLYDCYGTDGKLIIHYCKNHAWG